MIADDPCDEWPVLLVPGVAAQLAAAMLSTFVSHSNLRFAKEHAFLKGSTFTARPYRLPE